MNRRSIGVEEQTKNFRKNTRFEILTPSGFQPFSGITKRFDHSVTFLTQTKKITTSYTHKFIIDLKEVIASELKIGDKLLENEIIIDIIAEDYMELYDPVEVGNGNIYIGNDFVHHNCEFLGSSNTLINGRTLGMMSSMIPEYHSDLGLDIYESPIKNQVYVISVDVSRGVGGDYSAFTIVDVTEMPYKLVGKFKNNNIAPMLFPDIILKAAKDYNNAYLLVETNDIGGQVADILYSDLEYENILCTLKENNQTYISAGFSKTTTLGVRTTKSVKRQGCFAIKSLLEEKKLQIFDADIIHEFSTFIEKNGSYQADEGYHDDLVMSLVLFAWLSTNKYFQELTDINVRDKIYKQQMLQIEDELTPFGIIDTGQEDTAFIDNNILWSTDKNIQWKDMMRE